MISKDDLKSFIQFRQTERSWHVPILAALCIGMPLMTGYFLDKVEDGILASMSGLLILYLPNTSLINRILLLIICSFVFIVSFLFGIIFSFNAILAPFALGFYIFILSYLTKYFKLKPPGSFFFILITAIAICMPFDLYDIPKKIGLITMGTISTCLLAFIYSIVTLRNQPSRTNVIINKNDNYFLIFEAAIDGFFIGSSLLIAYLLNLDNPYWVPVSCAAVMQGINSKHIWQRSLHRIVGTFIGVGLAWFLLNLQLSTLSICLAIITLQFCVELLVVRNYAMAVVFITALTIFLAEAGHSIRSSPDLSVYTRILDITLGSIIGAIGGWFLYHQKLKNGFKRQIRKTNIQLKKLR
ncbi:FUSC family protein [Neisseria sp. Ec49-e6-T10]|uniref:FUSC family protein n=1 Tax=Neisseria sp. Ec49-e6-T10 TaxID=3140744 RepID=UPI003EB9E2C2